MAATAGKEGAVKLSTNSVALITSWTLDRTADMLEDTELGDDDRTYLPGLKGATASCEGFLDISDTNGQAALESAYNNGTSVSARLYTNATDYYSGTAYVSNISIGDDKEELISVSFDLQFSGAVSLTDGVS